MSTRRIRIPDFDAVLSKILEEYGNNVTEGMKKAVEKTAEVAKKETQAGANVETGKYRAGWAVNKQGISRVSYEAIVYNRTRYQLAHLLEHGHAKANGGRVRAFPHIEPAERHAIENMEKVVQELANR